MALLQLTYPKGLSLDLNYVEMLQDTKHQEQWKEAMRKEITSLEKMGCWKEVPQSQAKGKIIPTQWVFKIKRKPNGSLDKYKACLCARGDLMKDYGFETTSPVSIWSTLRIMLILCLVWGWYSGTCDYSNAFVHATLSTPVWIHLPHGYSCSKPGKWCLELLQSLYGTSFAPCLWYECLCEALKKYGLKPSLHDPCLFFKPGMLVALWVDDLLVVYKDKEELKQFEAEMHKLGFDLAIESTLENFLGIKFECRANGAFELTQPALIEKIIEATGMENCNPNATPALSGTTLGKDPDGEPMKETWSYPSMIGMLLYLSTNTRIDIAFAVSQVARFTHNPKQSHAKAVKHLVRYLTGSKDKGTIYEPTGTLALTAFTDADFAGLYKVDPQEDPSSAKSHMGYVIKLGGCPLVWKSQLIKCTCLSTTEAEYYALSTCLLNLIPIRCVLEELAEAMELDVSLEAGVASEVFEDNSAALLLANTQHLTSHTHYYHVKYHHFWEYVKDGFVQVLPIETSKQQADYLTKALARVPFQANCKANQGW